MKTLVMILFEDFFLPKKEGENKLKLFFEKKLLELIMISREKIVFSISINFFMPGKEQEKSFIFLVWREKCENHLWDFFCIEFCDKNFDGISN